MSTPDPPARRFVVAVAATALAGPAVVLLADRGDRGGLGPWLAVAAAAAVAVAGVRAGGGARGGWRGPVLGMVLVLMALLLLAETPLGVITVVVAAVAGVGCGLLAGRGIGRPGAAVTAALAVTVVAVVAAILGRVAGLQAAGVLAVLVAVVVVAGRGTVPVSSRPSALGRRLVAVAAAALALGLILWVAANDPGVQWFGPVADHGPRQGAQVALTFDDGPDGRWSLEVARILDAHGVKGTFFEVGKAVDAQPAVVRRLYADGHLLANHSYHHDSWRWLDPRYPELDRTQRALRRHVGVCPALFRPPHGQRTPLLLWQVRRSGLRTVTWDVSAADWSDTDGRRVARRIVDRARPGSIILLHDGLDGSGTADRSVLLTALPRVLDGLEAKGLEPVRVDDLLGLPGYLDPDDC